MQQFNDILLIKRRVILWLFWRGGGKQHPQLTFPNITTKFWLGQLIQCPCVVDDWYGAFFMVGIVQNLLQVLSFN